MSKPTLESYVPTRPSEPNEFRRLHERINDAIMDAMSEDERALIKKHLPHPAKPVSVRDLVPILSRSHSRIGQYRSGTVDVPTEIIMLMRIILERVETNPAPAKDAYIAWVHRYRGHKAPVHTIARTAEILNTQETTVRAIIDDGRVDTVTEFGVTMVDANSLDQFIEQTQENGKRDADEES